MMEDTGGIVCLVFSVAIVASVLIYGFLHFSPITYKTDDPISCKKILSCKSFFAAGYRENRFSAAESRALPNQRLVTAFGIDNSFTTADENFRKTFKHNAAKRLSPIWKNIADDAKAVVSARLNSAQSTPNAKVHLDDLVRSICLRITLQVFFNLVPLKLDEKLMQNVTNGINDLWVQSKTQKPRNESTQSSLRASMADILLPIHDIDSKENPLNYILPAYETLWRVVLSCFIEVTFREGTDSTWSDILERFASHPSSTSFKFPGPAPKHVSADFIIHGALRLYPSTKSVYRTFRTKYWFWKTEVVADIQGCHQRSDIWTNPETYDPSRWANISEEARQAYMPFGHGDFVCPAKFQYGPWIIAVLVAALTTYIKESDYDLWLYKDNSVPINGIKQGATLVADRKTYIMIEIQRRNP